MRALAFAPAAAALLLAGSLASLASLAPPPAEPRSDLTRVGDRIAEYLSLEASWMGEDARAPDAPPCPSLEGAVSEHFAYLGRSAPDVPALGVDPRLAEAAACLLDALLRANQLRDQAFAGVRYADLLPFIGSDERDPTHLLAGVDQGKMLEAALVIAQAVDAALPLLGDVPLNGAPIDLEPVLYIDADGVDTTHALDYALTLELGGNDLYLNHAGGAFVAVGSPFLPGPGILGDNSTYQHVLDLPLETQVVIGGAFEDADLILASTLVLDLAGHDTYGAKEAPNTDAICTSEPVVRRVAIQGTGVASVAMLIDVAGDNTLTSKSIAQGTGHVGGVGVLYLGPGDDTLTTVRSAQGSGVFQGTGLLVNEAGDDHYVAEAPAGGVFNGDRGICDTVPRYTQGSGFGRSGGAAAGVAGFLVDEAGHDTYEAVDKALGHSEVAGIGVLLEKDGDDAYAARNKTLGFATGDSDVGGPGLAAFLDLAGTDTYAVPGTKGLGYGNGTLPSNVPPPSQPIQDWLNEVLENQALPLVPASAALFYEHAGTDVYALGAMARSNGATEAHGAVGAFVDRT